jgi:hypothetical protein
VPPHTSVPGQVPQLSWPPHPFGGLPHIAPIDPHVVGVHVHAPAPLHVSGAMHAPQDRVPPQPSGHEPQLLPIPPHVLGVQPQTLAVGLVPPPHVCPAGQLPPFVPQVTVPPQPSETIPQSRPAGQVVIGEQAPLPQTFGVPGPPSAWAPPQVPPSQPPQLMVPPQPSGAIPHCRPGWPHAFGVQPHDIVPFAFVMHVLPAPHVPHTRKAPHPSLGLPHVAPSPGHVRGTQESEASEPPVSGRTVESVVASLVPVSVPVSMPASVPVPVHWPATQACPVHTAHSTPPTPQWTGSSTPPGSQRMPLQHPAHVAGSHSHCPPVEHE